MAAVKGKEAVNRFIAALPEKLRTDVLRGAARTAAKVVSEEAKERSVSREVANHVRVKTRLAGDHVRGTVYVAMKGYNLPLWLEYGTAPHFISVDDSQRAGMSVRRINDNTKAGALVINGQFVGDTVHHPGARPHPFMRPALDTKQDEAIGAAQQYINSRVTRAGIVGSDAGDDEE